MPRKVVSPTTKKIKSTCILCGTESPFNLCFKCYKISTFLQEKQIIKILNKNPYYFDKLKDYILKCLQ